MKITICESVYGQIMNEDVDFSSFETKEELCPYIFHNNLKMHEEVASALMRIATDFYDFLQLEWLPNILFDVQLVGSLASYNWSENYSDLDLHLILPYDKITKNTDLLENDFWALKTVYNYQHNLTMKGFDVEVYVQDVDADIESEGIFSIMRQTWIKKPEKKTVTMDKGKIQNIVSAFEIKIDEALSEYKQGNYDIAKDLFTTIHEKMSELRKYGLEHGGEFSAQNLAFKAMRRNGLLDKVMDAETKSFDHENSIEKKGNEQFGMMQQQKKGRGSANKSGGQHPTGSGGSEKGKEQKPDEKPGYSDGIAYNINGRPFSSLRQAEEELKIPHSTLNYRVNSDVPKWGGYKKISTSK